MPILNIGFAETVAVDQFGKPIPVQTVPPDASMWPIQLAIVADPGTLMTNPVPSRTRWLRLQCDVRCEFWVHSGNANFPGTGGFIMEAGQTEMFGIDKDAYTDVTELKLRVRTA